MRASRTDEPPTAGPPLSGPFRGGLDTLASLLNGKTGITGFLELLPALVIFDRLWHTGETGSSERIAAYMQEQHGWSRRAAEQAAYTWRVVAGLRNLDLVLHGDQEDRNHEQE